MTPNNTPPETAATTNKAVPPPEPPYIPPAVATPALSNVVNERAAFEDRVHGLTSGKVPEVKNPQDLATLAKQLTNPKEDEVVRHEIVNLLTRSNYQELEPLLFKILENPAEDQKFRAWTKLPRDKLPRDRPAEQGTGPTAPCPVMGQSDR